MTYEPTTEQIEIWHAREQELVDLRRHYRAMGWWAAWRVSLRNTAGLWFLDWSERLLSPNVSPTSRDEFDRVFTHLSIDTDAASEGFEERSELERRNLPRWMGGERG